MCILAFLIALVGGTLGGWWLRSKQAGLPFLPKL